MTNDDAIEIFFEKSKNYKPGGLDREFAERCINGDMGLMVMWEDVRLAIETAFERGRDYEADIHASEDPSY